jgi:hypothetical protein
VEQVWSQEGLVDNCSLEAWLAQWIIAVRKSRLRPLLSIAIRQSPIANASAIHAVQYGSGSDRTQEEFFSGLGYWESDGWV